MAKKIKRVKNLKKILLYVLIFILTGGLLYGLMRICFVALVNGRLISRFSVIRELEKQGGQKTLDVIILKALITQEAKKKKIAVSQKDIDAEIKKIETNIISQGLTLDQLLEQQGMTKNSLNEEIKIQLYLNKLVGSDIKVSDKEVDDYLVSLRESASEATSEEPTREEIMSLLKQQKLQENIKDYLSDLKSKAKINYFVKY